MEIKMNLVKSSSTKIRLSCGSKRILAISQKKNPENFKLRNLKDPKQSSKFNSNSKIHKLNLCGLCSNK